MASATAACTSSSSTSIPIPVVSVPSTSTSTGNSAPGLVLALSAAVPVLPDAEHADNTNTNTNTNTVIVQHPGLHVLLVISGRRILVLDPASATLLHTTQLDTHLQESSTSADTPASVSAPLKVDPDDVVNVHYLPGCNRIVCWDKKSVGVRSDHNGVLLLETILQQPLENACSDRVVKIEMFLSEAVLLYQCMESLDMASVNCSREVMKALQDAIEKANRLPKKGIKAQKWSTVTLELPHLSVKLVASTVVSELKKQKRSIPALAIAAALNQRITDLMPSNSYVSNASHDRALMFSEAARRETFKKWPHMDYKWALPSQLAQAGFYHNPTTNGGDRAMCFTCFVCLVSWERMDEPWSEHERHSPNCPLVKGDYTHNVPLSITNATCPAHSQPDISVISKGNSGDIFATGSKDGKVSIWNVDCKLKLKQSFSISINDPALHNITYGLYSNTQKTWNEIADDIDDSLSLTSIAVIGQCQTKEPLPNKPQTSQSESYNEQTDVQCRTRPSIVCGVKVKIPADSSKLTNRIWCGNNEQTTSKDNQTPSSAKVKAMNDQNQAISDYGSKSNCYLIVYDFQGQCAQSTSPLVNGTENVSSKSIVSKSGGSKKCPRIDNPNCRISNDDELIDDKICTFMCFDGTPMISPTDLSFVNLNEQVTLIDFKKNYVATNKAQNLESNISHIGNHNPYHVLSMNLPLPTPYSLNSNQEQDSSADSFIMPSVDKNIEMVKIQDEVDAAMDNINSSHMHIQNLPITGISELLYEYKDSGIKMKVPLNNPPSPKLAGDKSTNSSDGESSQQEENEDVCCTIIQCLPFPSSSYNRSDLTISDIIPTNRGGHILVVLSSVSEETESPDIVNGFDDKMDVDCDDIMNVDSNSQTQSSTSGGSYLVLCSLKFDSEVTLINEMPECITELSFDETPVEICILPDGETNVHSLGLAAIVSKDGVLRLYDIKTLASIAEVSLPSSKFISVTYCSNLEKICACSKEGMLYFYGLKDIENEFDSVDRNADNNMSTYESLPLYEAMDDSPCQSALNLLAYKQNLEKVDLEYLTQLASIIGKDDNVVAYSAVVPSCWCELLPTQRPRTDNEHVNRTWRLQNTTTTWDEHILELTLPWSLTIAHVELKFTLLQPCPSPPNIEVTLLKQNPQSLGAKKCSFSSTNKVDDRIEFNLMDIEQKGSIENPVRSQKYLAANHTEILAGPIPLAQCLDLTMQGGSVTLTSPKLYRARGRTLLLHIKTLLNNSTKETGKIPAKKHKSSESHDLYSLPGANVERFASKKGDTYVGCDWLHEISVTVRSNKHTEISNERLQRIAMLENNKFLKNLINIATNNSDRESQSLALDLLIWCISIRLTRFRHPKDDLTDEKNAFENFDTDTESSDSRNKCSETDADPQQIECIKILILNVNALIKNCILLAKRSMAKKCVRLILLCSEGAKNIQEEFSYTFEFVVLDSIKECLPLVGIVESAGSLHWLAKLTMRILPLDGDQYCATTCINILKDIACLMQYKCNPYHQLLQTRYGLYGLPMEPTVFDIESPIVSKSSSIFNSLENLGYNSVSSTPSPPEIDLRDLYNFNGEKNSNWWSSDESGGYNVTGLGEVMPLKCICHTASIGTKLENPPRTTTMNSTNTESLYGSNATSTMPWQQLVQQPPQQVLVVQKMHSGARNFVILDFCYPVRLTDIIIPTCPELITLSVDVWLKSEDHDNVRLVLAPDICMKNLIMTDIQPPPLCRYLKITAIGKYNIATSKCKIPLGWYYGYIDTSALGCFESNINVLTGLHQDITCRFRLAVGKLRDSLESYVDLSGGNIAHMTAYIEQDCEADPKIYTAYQECLDLQQQINTVEGILNRLKNNYVPSKIPMKESSFSLLKSANTDKLRNIAEEMTNILLYFCFESNSSKQINLPVSITACSQIIKWLVVCGGAGGPRLQTGLANILTKLCCTQPWWGSFISDTLAQLYSPTNTLIFPQDRVMILLIYMGRKSMLAGDAHNPGVIECVAKLVSQLLPSSARNASSSSSNSYEPVWQKTDMGLLSWLLIFLSACLDTAQPKENNNSWTRWDFLYGGNNSSSNNVNTNSSSNSRTTCISKYGRRKMSRKLLASKLDELDTMRKVQALSTLSSQAAVSTSQANTSNFTKLHGTLKPENNTLFITSMKPQFIKYFEDYLQNKFARARKFTHAPPSASTSRQGSSAVIDAESSATISAKLSQLISHSLAIEVSRGLIRLILSMDFTSNTDLLLLACKVVGRLNNICRGLPNIVNESEVLGLMRATCSSAPWQQHALSSLLQDLMEYGRPNTVAATSAFVETTSSESSRRPRSMSESDAGNEILVVDAPSVNHIAKGGSHIPSAPTHYHLPSLIESDDSDVEDILDESQSKGWKYLLTKVPVKTFNDMPNGNSIAIDSRLDSGIDMAGELLIRHLTLIGVGSLSAAINSPPIVNSSPNSTDTHVDRNPNTWAELLNAVSNSFDYLFIEMETQNDSEYLEKMLQLWVTLNGCTWDTPSMTAITDTTPKIKLTAQAVSSLINALNQHHHVSLRSWILGFQCLSSLSTTYVNLRDLMIQESMASVIIGKKEFSEMLIKFLSSNLTSELSDHSEKPYVGPFACVTFNFLLERLVQRAPELASTALLSTLLQLTGSMGALYFKIGPLDAQLQFINTVSMNPSQYGPNHLLEAMSLVENIVILIHSGCNTNNSEVAVLSNNMNLSCSYNNSYALGGFLSEVLANNSENVKKDKLASQKDIYISLLYLARSLIAIPLHVEKETDEISTDESQTDECKAFQQYAFVENVSDELVLPARKPCLADTVLQHYPTVRRLFTTIASLSLSSSYIRPNNPTEESSEDHQIGDAILTFVMRLTEKATHPRLILSPLLQFIDNTKNATQINLSEPLIWFMMNYLETAGALETFVSLGGIEIVCSRLVSCHQSQLSPRPGLVASLMNHFKPLTQIINTSTIINNSSDKAHQASIEMSQGLVNFAPLCTINCSNPTVQSADVLLGSYSSIHSSTTAQHRRTRSASWVHHFNSGENWINLQVDLPHCILLHEVHLQPHQATLSTCPSAVAIEVVTAGCVLTPLGLPQTTAGMNYIRLKLSKPLVVISVLIRLYKPKDSGNMGLLNIRILGKTAFGFPMVSSKQEEKMANTSIGWSKILAGCVCGSTPTHIEARSRATNAHGLSEAIVSLLLAASASYSPPIDLLLAMGFEGQTSLKILNLILKNAHVPAHYGYNYSSQMPNVNTIDIVSDILYQMCTIQDEFTENRLKTFMSWLKDCGESAITHYRQMNQNQIGNINITSKYMSSIYIQCLASILWYMNEIGTSFDLSALVTREIFEVIFSWVSLIDADCPIKKSLDAVLCSICYIKPEMFTESLQKMGILMPDLILSHEVTEASISDDRKDYQAKEAMTDDTKSEMETVLVPTPLENLKITASQLTTITAAAMSLNCTKLLMESKLPHNIAEAIRCFCMECQILGDLPDSALTDSLKASCLDSHYENSKGLISLEMMPILVERLSHLCMDSNIKTWLGTSEGSCFWTPLLLMLCLPDGNVKKWLKNESYIQLEEKTIQFFSIVINNHFANQQLFASTLIHIINSHPDVAPGMGAPINGFTRSLILKLLLKNERVNLAVRMGNKRTSGQSTLSNINVKPAPGTPPPPRPLSWHPSLHGCALLSLPHHTNVLSLMTQHLTLSGPVCNSNDLSTNSKKMSVNQIPISTESNKLFNISSAVEAWELSVAAANTAKDKRAKDAKNLVTMLGNSKKKSIVACSSSNKKDEQITISTAPSASTSGVGSGSSTDPYIMSNMRIFVDNLGDIVPLGTSLGALCGVAPQKFGPGLNISIIQALSNSNEPDGSIISNLLLNQKTEPSPLNIFANSGGLALLAQHLPPVCPLPQQTNAYSKDSSNKPEWVILDEIYEDTNEGSSNSTSEDGRNSVPNHSLVALAFLLKIPGYAEALLKEGQKAVYLLRLLLGITDDGEGKDILSFGGSSLGTLAFRVLETLLEGSPLSTDDGILLRSTLLKSGTLKMLLMCLAIFTHQQPDSTPSEATNANGGVSKSKDEENGKLYWAKGTGFGTGSVQQSWNVEQSLMKQKTEEEHITILLQVIASYIRPNEKWHIEDQKYVADMKYDPARDAKQPSLPIELAEMIQKSALLPAISSYLRNDSVLDMSRHIRLYLAVMRVVRAIMTSGILFTCENGTITLPPSIAVIPSLLHQMNKTIDTYTKKLTMNKKTLSEKSDVNKFAPSSFDITEDDEGLQTLTLFIQATSRLIKAKLGLSDDSVQNSTALLPGISQPPSLATREAKYLEVMKRLQFETFEMIGECPNNGFKFNVPYHFESNVRSAGERCHPARMKRLAQEAVTLSTSLPLSYSSSVFVRTDQDRLDVMKVLITGPSDTPYANGCFELDVYFPVEYPNSPMLINLETTGRHSVRFNPNLYLDGKVCLSVLNTWHGRPEEQWNAQTSSFLQVLVSIQSLILVPEPYFNEPGFERSRGTPGGTNHSLEYNSNIYQACVRWAMLEQLRNPTSCFKQVIQTHFWLKRDEICSVIEGWITELETQAGDKRTQKNICLNAIALKRHYSSLRIELAKLPVPPGLEELETPFNADVKLKESPTTSSSPNFQLEDTILSQVMDQDMEKIVSEVCE